MRITALNINDIIFEKKDVSLELHDSIYRRGLAFPIKIELKENKYYCVDGHKRLTVLKELSLDQPNHRYVTKIPVILVNTDNNRSNDCWRPRNVH